MVLARQIGEAEKAEVLAKQGLRCFIDGHPIDDLDDVEFDHIHAFAEGGESKPANIGVVCRKHNREKGTLSLSEYRDKIELRRFFEGAKKRRLDDLLEAKVGPRGYGQPLNIELKDGRAILYLDSGRYETPIAECPATHEPYFFAMLPVSVLRNDAELQPRALEINRVWELYRHLLTHTQLAPAVCRLVGKSVLLLDGQHKAAAQVWAGRDRVDCKIYIEPEVRRLKETNLSAHDKLRQMPFFTSTLLEKYAGMAREDWEVFLASPGAKTEATFVDFMRTKYNLSKAESVKRIRSMIYQDVIESPANTLRDYIAEENRGRSNPVTISRLEKTFFTEFVTAPPLSDEFESESYHRDEERDNLVRLFNLVVTHALADRWAPERADAAHQRATRQFSAGALRAWVPFLRDALAGGLQLFDTEDRRRIFYRELGDPEFAIIQRLLQRLLNHKVWDDPSPELNDLRYDDAERAKEMLRTRGLSPNWILGGEA
ncbi:MAG TPA: HNH endonuclease signature motif containing protein [Candidatus Dormibacteraeota bacterium]|nr:HNH endonuclease signature motif containing protein [Candidatus Dormibacteraeota bacterium]